MLEFRVEAGRPDRHTLHRAAALLRDGGVVAYPTDTLYGLAANPASAAAMAQLYRIKGRPVDLAIPLIASGTGQIEAAGGVLDPASRRLAEAFWPGPLTLVIPAWPQLDAHVHAGRGTVAIRVPDLPVARLLADACGWPITSTSANRSGDPATEDPDAVRVALGGLLDGLIDAGPSPGGEPSTIVDASGAVPVLIRAGAVSWDRVLECLL
ncbi:MAG: L-threonylcarbamoyladenylate synthase [Vicinamibacterales bacterium]|jgi:L-threonylcarbamoyladenylate synthase|nr:L-threonylcarbamoyladenylate synthase [Vicinamibacterales bacterium]